MPSRRTKDYPSFSADLRAGQANKPILGVTIQAEHYQSKSWAGRKQNGGVKSVEQTGGFQLRGNWGTERHFTPDGLTEGHHPIDPFAGFIRWRTKLLYGAFGPD